MARKHLTDEEILAIQFHTGDPHASYQLLATDDVPADPKWIELIALYYSHDAVKCMRRDCGQFHNDGAIVSVQLDDGRIGQIAVGHVCGSQLFPEEYKAGSSRFGTHLDHRRRAEAKRDAMARELLLHRNLILRKREILRRQPEIEAWFARARQPFSDYDQARLSFESCMPDLFDHLSRAARGNGQLVVYRTPQGKSKVRQELDGQKVWDDMWDVVHVLSGPRFFDRGGLVERTEKAALECDEILDRLQPDNLSVTEMQDLTRRLATIGDLLHRMTTQYLDMFQALSEANLRGIARWHRRHEPRSPYLYTNGALLRQATKGLPAFQLKAIVHQPLAVSGFPIAKLA